MKDLLKVGSGWAGTRTYYCKHIWVRYKLTLEAWQIFWDGQSGKCAGCLEEFAHPLNKSMLIGLKPEVDHCHKTERVRGLLCRRCNDFLGKIQDDQERMQRLVDYLKRNGDWPS